VAQPLLRAAFWFCASNLLAAALAAQCTNPTPVLTNQTVSSGSANYRDNNALDTNAIINGSASLAFVAGHCIDLQTGFHATAGTAATTFHAWVDTAPSALSVSPPSSPPGGGPLTQAFTWTVSSPSGYGYLSNLQALFNTSIFTQNACLIAYNPNLLFVKDRSGTNWSSGIVPGSSATTGNFNSNCTINGAGSSVSHPSATQLAVTVSVTFQTAFAGTWTNYLIAYDQAGLDSAWQPVGTWTVPAPQQYYLTTTANPAAGGTISPPSGWHNPGEVVTLSATPNSGYQFVGFTGPPLSGTPPQNLTMNGPAAVTANFSLTPVTITVNTSPGGLQVTADGVVCSAAPCAYQWNPGSTHNIGVNTTTQPGSTGTQYVYSSWSDSGAQTRSITVPSAAYTYTAAFTTQYLLTTNVNCPFNSGQPTGSISPPSGGWFSLGSQAPVTGAATQQGFAFAYFTGALQGTTASQTLTMTGPATVTATIVQPYFVYNPLQPITLAVGQTQPVTVTMSPYYGFDPATEIQTSVTNGPINPGLNAYFLNGGLGQVSSALTLQITANAQSQSGMPYLVQFTGTSGTGGTAPQIQITGYIYVTVTPGNPSFTMNNIASQALAPGQSINGIPISATSHFNSQVNFSYTETGNTSNGILVSFATTSNLNALMSITATSTALPGLYQITVTGTSSGTSGPITAKTVMWVTVTLAGSAPDFYLSPLPGLTIFPGGDGSVTETLTAANQFNFPSTPVGFTWTVPAGWPQPVLTENPTTTGSTTITVSPSADAQPGAYTLSFTASGGGASHSGTLMVTVLDTHPPRQPDTRAADVPTYSGSGLNYQVIRQDGNHVKLYAETVPTGQYPACVVPYIATWLYRDSTLINSSPNAASLPGVSATYGWSVTLEASGPGLYSMTAYHSAYNTCLGQWMPCAAGCTNGLGYSYSPPLTVARPARPDYAPLYMTSLWYLGPGIVSDGFYTARTAFIPGAPNGAPESPVFFVTAGGDKLSLSCTNCARPLATAKASSAGCSVYDVVVKTGYGSSALGYFFSDAFFIFINRPWNTVAASDQADPATGWCGGDNGPWVRSCPRGNGWETRINYQVSSMCLLDQPMSDYDVNEQFSGTFVPDYSGDNWGAGPPHPVSVPPGDTQWFDGIFVYITDSSPGDPAYCSAGVLCVPQFSNPGVGTHTLVDHISQSWFIGSLAAGSGARIQTDTLQRYTDSGWHTDIVTPKP
jgi:hypothetical protein